MRIHRGKTSVGSQNGRATFSARSSARFSNNAGHKVSAGTKVLQVSCKSLLDTRYVEERIARSGTSSEAPSPCLTTGRSATFRGSKKFRHRPCADINLGEKRNRSTSIGRTASMITVLPVRRAELTLRKIHAIKSSGRPIKEEASEYSPLVGPSRKRTGVRERSRQMMRYVQEQRAARTLSIVVGAFIICWMPFFIFSPIMTVCERERRMKTAIKTPLTIVFAQLVSITQFWEQTPDCSPSTVID